MKTQLLRQILSLLMSFVFSSGISQIGKTNDTFGLDSTLGVKYFNISDSSFMNVNKCIRYSHLAIPLLRKTNQWEKYVSCLAGLSYCYNVKGEYDSLEINNILAFEVAKKYLPDTSYFYIATLNNLGYVYENIRQDYNKALMLYKTGLELFEQTNTHHAVNGTLYKNLGEIYLKKGDFKQSILHFQAALGHFETTQLYVEKVYPIYFKVAEIHQSLARVYQYQHKYSDAIHHLEEMLNLMNSNNQKFNISYYANCYTHLAEISLEEEKGQVAASYLKKALLLKELSLQQKSKINKLYSQLYLAQGNLKRARRYADFAMQQVPSSKPIDVAAIFHIQGQILSGENKYDEALILFSKAIEQLIPNATISLDSFSLHPQWKIRSRLDLIDQISAISKCYAKLFDKNKDIKYLKRRLNCFMLISELGDQIRQNYESEESKIFLNELAHVYYEKGIATAHQLFQISQNEMYLDKAFYLFEKSKSVLLLEELKAKEAVGIFTIPAELISAKYQLRSDINYCRKMLDKASRESTYFNTKKTSNWNSQLLKLIEQRKELNAKIHQVAPNYAALTKGKIPNMKAIQKELAVSTVAIAYFLGEQHSYVFFITKNNSQLREISSEQSLQKTVLQVLGELKMNHQNSILKFQKFAHQLYKEILGGFDFSSIKKMIIIPDGALRFLPFEILLPTASKKHSPKKFDYLFKHQTISYAYSLALLQLQQKTISAGGKALLVAPVFKNNPIKHLRYSAKNIAAFENVNHLFLKYDEANIDNFFKHVPDFNLIYFSTHAIAMDSSRNEPAIEFIDKKLYLSDLYNLRLSAELVVLSACQTGIGELHKGEGMMSLARGFTYAGVPSVVTTLWKVNEKATNIIIENFYEHLSKGMDKDEALRLAKINYLENCKDTKATPYFWASFVVIGNTQPFSFEKKTPFKLIAFFMFISLSFLWLVRRKWNK